MYFKNKTTGIVWHITDETHQKRLKGDTGYIEVTDDKKCIDDDKKPSDKLYKEVDSQKVDYNSMDWHELRKIASDNGINTKGKKRQEIEDELLKLGDADVTK